MHDWITFYDRPSAIAYIKERQAKGYIASYEHKGNEYRVKVEDSKDFHIHAQTFEDKEDGDFFVSHKKLGTHAKLHEYGHMNTEQYSKGGMDEIIDNELRAEKWARDKQGKEITAHSLFQIVANVKIDSSILSGNEALKMVMDRLVANKIELSKDKKDELENMVKQRFG